MTLVGSAPLSGNPWGANVSYAWALTDPSSGVAVTFGDDAAATSTVTIPALPVGTVLTFTLTVTGRGKKESTIYIKTATTVVSAVATVPRRSQEPLGNSQRDRPDQPLLECPGERRRLPHHRLQDRGLPRRRLQLDRPRRQHQRR